MNDEQRFLYDMFGYIVVPGVLTQEQVDLLRSTIGHATEQWEPDHKHDAPLHWHSIWRDLLDLPTLAPILDDMIGTGGRSESPTYRIDHINVHTHVSQGFPGGHLHGGGGPLAGFAYHDGRFHSRLLSVSFELYDTQPNDGGFACVRGSHKSNVPFPPHWRDLSKGVNPCVTRVTANAGDAILFTEALTHGTLPWTSDAPRSTVFYKFSPPDHTWAANYFDPDDYRGYEDMDTRKLAILEPPNARYRGRPTNPHSETPQNIRNDTQAD